MNIMYISTKMYTPEKAGQKQGVPSTLKSRGNVALSTHGSTPMGANTPLLPPVASLCLLPQFRLHYVSGGHVYVQHMPGEGQDMMSSGQLSPVPTCVLYRLLHVKRKLIRFSELYLCVARVL